AVAGSCLVNDILGRFTDLILGLLGRAELPGDTPDAGGSRGDRQRGQMGLPKRGLVEGPVESAQGGGGTVHSAQNARHSFFLQSRQSATVASRSFRTAISEAHRPVYYRDFRRRRRDGGPWPGPRGDLSCGCRAGTRP